MNVRRIFNETLLMVLIDRHYCNSPLSHYYCLKIIASSDNFCTDKNVKNIPVLDLLLLDNTLSFIMYLF